MLCDKNEQISILIQETIDGSIVKGRYGVVVFQNYISEFIFFDCFIEEIRRKELLSFWKKGMGLQVMTDPTGKIFKLKNNSTKNNLGNVHYDYYDIESNPSNSFLISGLYNGLY